MGRWGCGGFGKVRGASATEPIHGEGPVGLAVWLMGARLHCEAGELGGSREDSGTQRGRAGVAQHAQRLTAARRQLLCTIVHAPG